MKKVLTKRQREILNFIDVFYKKNGYSPSQEEICKNFKLRSVSTIHQHLEAIKDKGYLSKNKNERRGFKPKKGGDTVEIPIVGTIAAGSPIEAIEILGETIAVTKDQIGKQGDYYALRVQGDSMIDEGIFDGDVVVIKKQSVAENGQTVVAIIDDNEATLKKLYREEGRIRLQPANSRMKPLFRTEVEVRGVVVQIVRDFDKEGTINKGFRTLDLFAGIGGIRLGFEKAGFETVLANDFDKPCKVTYDLNFPTSKLVVEDIRRIGIDDLPPFDFLLGGFPCQAFSVAGYRQGFKDKKGRGNLFFDIARIIDARKPTGFLLENVKNLKGHDGGNTFKVIEETLKDLGYHVKHAVLNSMEYGDVPQNRERIYIVGFRDKEYADNFEFPSPIKRKTKITDILEKNVPEKYYYNGKPLYPRLKDDIAEYGKVYQWRRRYVRENKSGVCPTLTANMGTGGHNVPIIKDRKGVRKLTPRECARIQGFPDSFKLPVNIADSALYKQIGNSVSVPVIERVARNIRKVIA